MEREKSVYLNGLLNYIGETTQVLESGVQIWFHQSHSLKVLTNIRIRQQLSH